MTDHSLLPRWCRRQYVLLLACLISTGLSFAHSRSTRATTDVGYRDFTFGTVSAPTAEKPQSKLWFHDGIWWGSLFNRAAGKYTIHRLDWATQTWSDTGTVIDERRTARMDCLWDGTHLYVATAVRPGTSTTDTRARVLRYSYSAASKTYTLNSGFPVVVAATVSSHATAAIVLDKDSTGKLWVTYTLDGKVYVAHSTTDDRTWTTPFVIPVTGATNLQSEDMSSVVAFNGKIGVMWSNQNDHAMYFAVHQDGEPDSTWAFNPAVQGPKYADNHLNLASLEADASGQVFAATKTSFNNGGTVKPDDPLILLLTLGQNGSWSRRTVWRVADDVTRAIVLIDNQNRGIYVFGVSPCCSGGTVYYKQASLDNASLQFPQGLGTPFIQLSTDPKINNVTSTKQALNSSTGLVVLAGDDSTKYYVHNAISLGTFPPDLVTFPPLPTVFLPFVRR